MRRDARVRRREGSRASGSRGAGRSCRRRPSRNLRQSMAFAADVQLREVDHGLAQRPWDTDGLEDDATVSVHVVTLRWTQVWRAPLHVRTARRLGNATGVRFAVCGRASGGDGLRRINRTLSLRRMIVIVEWTSADAARTGRDLVDASWPR